MFQKLGELMFQVTEQLGELKDGEKQQHRSMENIEASEAVVKRHLMKTEAELLRQKEVLYNMVSTCVNIKETTSRFIHFFPGLCLHGKRHAA